MLQCPQCSKALREMTRKCPSCQADLDLLVDYVSQLQAGLEQAGRFTRDGELAKAFWAYMAVLEVDPDNPTARRQVGQVVTAVRQFDRTAPGRRWLQGLPPRVDRDRPPRMAAWVKGVLVGMVVFMAFLVGFASGRGLPAVESSP